MNGHTFCKSPDYILNTFLNLSRRLHESAYQWKIQLCSAYYTALTEYLAKIMVNDKFVMPSMIALDKKEKQLSAL